MANAQGAKGYLAIQKETTFGVDPVSPAMKRLWFETENIRGAAPLEGAPMIRGNRNPITPVLGGEVVEGDFSTYLMPYPGQLFHGVLGSVTTSGAGPYTHTIKVGDTLPSWVLEKGFTGISQYFKYNGWTFGTLSMDITPTGLQRITFGGMGLFETVTQTPFDAVNTELNKRMFNGRSIGLIKEGGATIANVLGISNFTIDNGLDGDIFFLGGAGRRGGIEPSMVKVSGTLRATFQDITLYNKAVNSTESQLQVKYSLGDGLGSAGNESIDFYIPELVYSKQTPVINGPKGILVELPFEAYYYNSASASSIQITLKNTQANLN